MKRLESLLEKISFTKGIAGLAMAVAVFSLSALSCYAAEGKVTADTAKIRAEANTGSEVVGSTTKGKVIDLLGSVKDSSGTTWYKVSIAGGGYGYIRGDLVETSGDVPEVESSAAQTTTQTTTQETQPEATVPTSIGEQQATINSETNVRIRSGASTKHSVVTSLPNGTEITLIGEANDSAGNKWYQLRCNYNGRTVEGYVRSDLITIGGGAQDTEEETQQPAEGEVTEGGEVPAEGEEAPVEETPVEEPVEEHNDYEIVYTQNSEGTYEYYLYDNINGTRQKLAEILAVIDTAVASNQALQDKVNQNKIIIIILAVVIVLLFAVITVLLFKLRDFYYEEYDEDEEEEEEEEEEPIPVRRKVKRQMVEEEEEPVPVRKKKVQASSEEKAASPNRKAVSQSQKASSQGQKVSAQGAKASSQAQKPKVKKEEGADLYAAEKKAPVKKAPARKAQNFLVDDDEFEFEFLNMDDKDL